MSRNKPATGVAAVQTHLPAQASMEMYEEAGREGFENADASAYAIPFIAVLQAGSPQVKKSDGAYIKGAEEGALFNTVTQEVFDGEEGLKVVPCYFKRVFLKWAPRSSGGGFRGEFLPSDPIVATASNVDGNTVCPDGDLLVDTRVHYVLVLKDDGSYSPAVLSLSSTQLKKSRQWMSKMEGIKLRNAAGHLFTPPMFSHVYRLSTTPESNDKGSWFGVKIETVGMQEDPSLFAAAKEFKRQIASGETKEQAPVAPESSSNVVDY